MKGKSTFSKPEADQIIALIREKLKSSSDKQKGIRDKIRKLGFYASDFGLGGGYTEHDFLRVVKVVKASHAVESKPPEVAKPQIELKNKRTRQFARTQSDEAYVLDLCDELLGTKALRQYRFDFLKGDAGTKLPVDAYYPSINLVIEYRERQHTEVVKFFDRRETVSGIGRGEQRKKYDQLRREVLPQNGIKLIELGYEEFEHTSAKRLKRNREKDMELVIKKLKS